MHPLNEIDGSLNLSALAITSGARRGLANDITVCGELEPAAFVTEYFLGDGTTTQFNLAAEPFFPPASRVKIIDERFNEPNIDPGRWQTSGGAGCLSLGAGGLAMNGGTGIDGQTLLTWIDEIEMGGTLLLEATGVTLSPGSTGILGGFLSGLDTVPGCVAGFQATAQPGTGAVSLQPVVQGATSGIDLLHEPGESICAPHLDSLPRVPAIIEHLSILRRFRSDHVRGSGKSRVSEASVRDSGIRQWCRGYAREAI